MPDNNDFWKNPEGLRIERVDRDGNAKEHEGSNPLPLERKATPGPDQPPASSPAPKQKAQDQEFNVDFNFDDEYESPDERAARQRAIKPRRERRTGCLGGIMYFLFIICAAVIVASVGWIAAMDVFALGRDDKVIEVSIPKDFTIDEVTDVLYDNGLIKYKALFKLYSGFSEAETTIKAGTYQLNTSYDYRALVYGMTPSGGTRVDTEVTIPEGFTVRQIFKLLSANKICFEEDLWVAAANYEFEFDFLDSSTLGDKNRLEGYLFPDTYKFYVNDTPSRVINKFLNNFNNKFTEEYRARAAELGYTINEIVNIASLIEKEAAHDAERATIASVIYNRLSTNVTAGLLQVDATIYYGIAGTDTPFSTSLDNPYNTYLYAGLTPGPIANPGTASIKAALYPEDTGYIYYGLGKDGSHHFFKYYESFTDFLASDAYASSKS